MGPLCRLSSEDKSKVEGSLGKKHTDTQLPGLGLLRARAHHLIAYDGDALLVTPRDVREFFDLFQRDLPDLEETGVICRYLALALALLHHEQDLVLDGAVEVFHTIAALFQVIDFALQKGQLGHDVLLI